MKTNKVGKIKLIELNAKELNQINGGSILSFLDSCVAMATNGIKSLGLWGAAVGWFVWETLTNPIESYDSFMKGWNAR